MPSIVSKLLLAVLFFYGETSESFASVQHFRATTSLYLGLTKEGNKSTTRLGPLENLLFHLLAERLNYTYELARGSTTATNTSLAIKNGAAGNRCLEEIQRNGTDICFLHASSWESPEEHAVADFTFPIAYDGFGIITGEPSKSRVNMVLAPFALTTWSILALAATLTLMVLWSSFLPNHDRNGRLSLSRWALVIVASISTGERGYHLNNVNRKSRSRVIRLLLVCWCFSSFVVTKLYGNFLFSIRAAPPNDYLIHTISDVIDHPDIRVYVFKGMNTETFFMAQTDGPFSIVGRQLRRHPEQRLPANNFSRVQDVVRNNGIFLGSLTLCQSIADTVRNDEQFERRIIVIEDKSFTLRGQIVLPKNPLLTNRFNTEILLLQQHGFIVYAERETRTFRNNRKLDGQLRDTYHPLSLAAMADVFKLILYGAPIALLVFAYETTMSSVRMERLSTLYRHLTGLLTKEHTEN